MSHISSSCFGVNSHILPPKKGSCRQSGVFVTPPFFTHTNPTLNPTCCCGLTRIRHHLGSLKPYKMLRHLSYQLVQDFSPSTRFNHFELSYARATEKGGFENPASWFSAAKTSSGPSAWRFPTKTKSLRPSFFLFLVRPFFFWDHVSMVLGPSIENMYLDIYHHKSMDQYISLYIFIYIFLYFSNILSFKPSFFHIALSFPVPFHVW